MEGNVTRWRCDVCGEWLTREQGYVVWGYGKPNGPTGFQIIHQKRCDDKSKPASAALGDFLGPDGFARTTALMTVGPIMRNQSPGSEVVERMADLDEFADFMRRLYIPHYEEARARFNDPEVLRDLQGANESRPYMQDILAVLARG